MNNDFQFTMISAMYENGGNTIQRMLDGHPELYVYPFESQLGTAKSNGFIQSLVPFRYCWPEFDMKGSARDDYEAFFDEEMKTFLRVPSRSKFKAADIDMNEQERKQKFDEYLKQHPRTRSSIIEAFFVSTFDSWKNFKRSGQEHIYVGYSPVMGLDSEKIFADFPQAQIIHIVRNPYSGYADTKKRPFPLTLKKYVWTWNIMQHMALTYAEQYPNNFHIVRFEDLVKDTKSEMEKLAKKVGIQFSETMLYPSWNSQPMTEIYPWGTIRQASTDANIATLNELTADEKAEIKITSSVMLKQLGYESLV